ncbi:uncharacterized protein C7orf31 homolog isoform X2 [Hemicordylus capensis]|nr:uncharacterized protein C7orf31 homolog isoform X2 [Hemicordylus capensis]XP_053118090.1 uncharacterized protein C7orf31 homolog isoform X2 [Hemicordylus capensis]
MLPESHRNYEPPYKFDHEHLYYGSTRDAPVRLPDLPENSVKCASRPEHKLPIQSTHLVESRYRPFHPYIHACRNLNIRGNAYRSEDASKPLEINMEATRWPGQYRCYHLSQSPGQGNDPNASPVKVPKSAWKPAELNISARAVNMLANVKKSLWLSTYKRDYTGTGPMNPLLLDDYDAKVIGRATGELGKDIELRQTFPSRTSQVRPLEGRIARFLQDRLPHAENTQQQDSVDVHFIQGMPPLQDTNNSAIGSYSGGVLSCGEILPKALQQHPNTENRTKRRNENLLQNQSQGDYQGGSGFLPGEGFRKITDTWKTEHLYQRQLTVPPEPEELLKPPDPIYYEDLKPSRLDKYIVWDNPVSLSKPGVEHLCYEKHGNLQDLQYASDLQDITDSRASPGWLPNCGVERPQTKLLDIQDSFTKTDTIKRFYELSRGGIRDLREHDREGKKHRFQGVIHAYLFH